MYQLRYSPIQRFPFIPVCPYAGYPQWILMLITADGTAHFCFTDKAHDSEAEAWLIHSCGLEGSQVEIINPIDIYSVL